MKYFITVLICVFMISANAQNKIPLAERKNELKVGSLQLLLAGNVDIAYEKLTSNSFGFGVSLYSGESLAPDNEFSISPFARVYFGENDKLGANGFFVEGAGKFSKNVGAGLSIGKKWVHKTGFIFETLIGLGRDFKSGQEVYPRGDLFIGYRF